MRSTLVRAALAALLALIPVVATAGAARAGGSAAPRVAATADGGCRPTAAHPNPVVLLHGLTGTGDSWTYLAPQLRAAGYCVFTPTYGRVDPDPDADVGGLASISRSAEEVRTHVQRVRAVTGAARVDIVGHSEGGFLGLYVPKVLGLAGVVGRVVALAPPTHGTTVSGLIPFADWLGIRPLVDELLRAFGCPACVDVLPGSPLVAALNDGPIAQPGVAYTVVATRFDTVVTPTATAFVPETGVRNLYVQDVCPFDPVGHVGLALDRSVLGLVLNALDPAHPQPVRCAVGLPF